MSERFRPAPPGEGPDLFERYTDFTDKVSLAVIAAGLLAIPVAPVFAGTAMFGGMGGYLGNRATEGLLKK
ncbi:MAG: hypothetical protein ACOCXQ_04975 [Patescibacteria group bacterium]